MKMNHSLNWNEAIQIKKKKMEKKKRTEKYVHKFEQENIFQF